MQECKPRGRGARKLIAAHEPIASVARAHAPLQLRRLSAPRFPRLPPAPRMPRSGHTARRKIQVDLEAPTRADGKSPSLSPTIVFNSAHAVNPASPFFASIASDAVPPFSVRLPGVSVPIQACQTLKPGSIFVGLLSGPSECTRSVANRTTPLELLFIIPCCSPVSAVRSKWSCVSVSVLWGDQPTREVCPCSLSGDRPSATS
jgi:hypothetical protein